MEIGRVHPYFSDRLVLEGIARSSAICCYPSGDMFWSMVKSEAENIMEAEI
jgi:hypothetical protein